MFNPTTTRAACRLALISLSIAVFAACDRTPTSPDPALRRAPELARHDIEGDTLACKSGYIIVDSRYVCL